jgi:drug/metabolite transporter (DMT)-like permease
MTTKYGALAIDGLTPTLVAKGSRQTASATLGTVALLVAYAGFGNSIVVSKIAVRGENPLLFELYRDLIVGPLFCLAGCVCTGRIFPLFEDAWRICVIITCHFLSVSCFITALKLGDSAGAAAWACGLPAITAAFAVLAGHECVSKDKAMGMFLAIAGTTFAVFGDLSFAEDAEEGRSDTTFVRNGLFAIGTCSLAIYIVLTKSCLVRYAAFSIVGWSFVGSAIMIGVFLFAVSSSTTLLPLLCWSPDSLMSRDCAQDPFVFHGDVFESLFSVTVLSLSWCLLVRGGESMAASAVALSSLAQPLVVTFVSSLIIWNKGAAWSQNNGIRTPDIHECVGLLITGLGLLFLTFDDSNNKEGDAPNQRLPVHQKRMQWNSPVDEEKACAPFKLEMPPQRPSVASEARPRSTSIWQEKNGKWEGDVAHAVQPTVARAPKPSTPLRAVSSIIADLGIKRSAPLGNQSPNASSGEKPSAPPPKGAASAASALAPPFGKKLHWQVLPESRLDGTVFKTIG